MKQATTQLPHRFGCCTTTTTTTNTVPKQDHHLIQQQPKAQRRPSWCRKSGILPLRQPLPLRWLLLLRILPILMIMDLWTIAAVEVADGGGILTTKQQQQRQQQQQPCTVLDQHGQKLNLKGPLPEGILYDTNLTRVICRDDYSCSGFTISGCFYVDCLGKHSCEKAHLPSNYQVKCSADYACHFVLALNGHEFRCGENNAKHSCQHAAFQTNSHVYCISNGACNHDSWEDRLHVAVGHSGKVLCLSETAAAATTIGPGQAGGSKSAMPDTLALPCRNIVLEVPTAHRACFSSNSSSMEELGRCSVFCYPDLSSCDMNQVQFMPPEN
ncbi:hypothetical protein ACA910_011225 [Epithemia clementina (nom. ined.)]